MTRRYFVPQLPRGGGIAVLNGPESHHAVTVMRARAGEPLELFDGEGWQAAAVIESADRRAVVCLCEPAIEIDRENAIELELGIAMPKGDRAGALVERLTELGVTRLVPLHCERTPWAVSDNAITKWEREVIDACKQSGRNQRMTISRPTPFSEWCQPTDETSWCLIAHPAVDANGSSPLELAPDDSRTRVRMAIGPEGGFTDAEIVLAESLGWQRWSIGNRILRIETAAIVAATIYGVLAPFSRVRYISRHGN